MEVEEVPGLAAGSWGIRGMRNEKCVRWLVCLRRGGTGCREGQNGGSGEGFDDR
jgi:hypothetical protein